ncbi:Uncharacterised protein [Mycobacteroides abscessus subsp. massiliense]|nr:Uncharacterised protein [Mycobacteroides abscessus subsp. massiliense]
MNHRVGLVEEKNAIERLIDHTIGFQRGLPNVPCDQVFAQYIFQFAFFDFVPGGPAKIICNAFSLTRFPIWPRTAAISAVAHSSLT